MTLPRILVIDDQLARDSVERDLFLRRTALVQEGEADARLSQGDAIATAEFCSGQRPSKGRIDNDYKVLRAAALQRKWAMILCDVQFDSGAIEESGRPCGEPGDSDFGERAVQRLSLECPSLPIVMLTSKRQRDLANSKSRFLSKEGIDRRAIGRALLESGSLTVEQQAVLLGLGGDTVVRSPVTMAAFRDAYIHALSAVPILILGESGVGKEILANYVHRVSGRSGAFVALNVAALPRDLVEAELFGIERGVATGVGERPGKFEIANGGTLFLDEIGDMPPETQAKLLRALQDKEVCRVGGRSAIQVDIRLVCATSRDLPGMVREGTFREDLYYRINTVPIILPPLRERPEEIVPLANVFLNRAALMAKKSGLSFSRPALRILEQYPFPGNVRELQNLVGRLASATGHNSLISEDSVALALAPTISAVGRNAFSEQKAVLHDADEAASLDDVIERMLRMVVDSNSPSLNGAIERLSNAYRALLKRLAGAALERCRDPISGVLNRQRAMKLLTGDSHLKGKAPGRLLNEILGRPQETPVTNDDLELLVAMWRAGDAEIASDRKFRRTLS